MMIDLSQSKVSYKEPGANHEIITVTPLPPGYGMTLGNSLRRILLSSLPGAAITAIKITGVPHEFTVIPGVKESMIDFILNLKQVRIKKFTAEPIYGTLKVTKEGPVTAGDIELPGDSEIVNKDLVIATLSKKAKLEMELKIESGTGYLPASNREKKELDPNMIAIDALFSPVKKVRYEVSNTRVGNMTNLDKLDFEVETDGSITPKDVLSFSAKILGEYASLLNFSAPRVSQQATSAGSEEEERDRKYTPVETLKLSPRTLNALINNGIGSVEQLIQLTEKQLSGMKGFGRKALTEVHTALKGISKALAE